MTPSSPARFLGIVLIGATALLASGCPHRSPIWSPDGKRLLLLCGSEGEAVDKPASQLWLHDVASKRGERMPAPDPDHRYLSAAWLDDDRAVVLTAKWDDDLAVEGTGLLRELNVNSSTWKTFAMPTPSEERAPRRPPVVFSTRGGRAIAYPTGFEAVVVVDLKSGKTLARFEPAELVGLGPRVDGLPGLMIYRIDPNTGGTRLVALGPDLEEIFSRDFAQIRAEIAKKLDKKPGNVAFNDTSTSHPTFARSTGTEAGSGSGGTARPETITVNFTFSDVGWKEGILGYQTRLNARSGAVLAVAQATCLPGLPVELDGRRYAVTAPVKKTGSALALAAFDAESGEKVLEKPLVGIAKAAVHGYTVDPRGRQIVLSISGKRPQLVFFDLPSLTESARVDL